jgi:hypothetical protein
MIRTLPTDLPAAALACSRCSAGTCCGCGSNICLHLSLAAQRQHEVNVARAPRHFARPAAFGYDADAGPDLADQCATRRTARTHDATTHSRPSASQQGRRGRANQAGIRTPAGE